MQQAARNRSGPISPASKGVTNMPSGRRARRRARFVFRMLKGSCRRSSPCARNIEGVKLDPFVMLAAVQGVEIGDTASPSIAADARVDEIWAKMDDVYERMLESKPTTLEGLRTLAQAITH